MQAVFERYDLIVSPTLAIPSVANAADGNTIGPTEINGDRVDPLIGWCMTFPINFTGHPAISVPAGLTGEGFPVGLQIIGRRHADETVLALASRFSNKRDPGRAHQPRLSRDNGKFGPIDAPPHGLRALARAIGAPQMLVLPEPEGPRSVRVLASVDLEVQIFDDRSGFVIDFLLTPLSAAITSGIQFVHRGPLCWRSFKSAVAQRGSS